MQTKFTVVLIMLKIKCNEILNRYVYYHFGVCNSTVLLLELTVVLKDERGPTEVNTKAE